MIVYEYAGMFDWWIWSTFLLWREQMNDERLFCRDCQVCQVEFSVDLHFPAPGSISDARHADYFTFMQCFHNFTCHVTHEKLET